MKIIQTIFVSVLVFFLLSCSNRENAVDKTETFDSIVVIDSTVTDTVDSINVINPENGQVNSPREAWLKLLNDYSGKPAGSGDRAFKAFLELQEKELTEVNERHKSSPINESLANAIFKKIKLSPREKLLVDSVESNG